MRRTVLMASALLGLGLGAGGAAAQPQPFDGMVVFGDSLSDNGDLSLSLGIPRARFTTNPGLVAVEDVARRYGLGLEPSLAGGSDYAFGGAGVIQGVLPVPTLPQQVGAYLAAHPQTGPNTLVSLWGGANDIFFHSANIQAGAETLAQANAQIVAAAQVEGQLIDRLQAAGVQRMIVFNLPDIGLAPGGRPQDTVLAQSYNGVLNAALAGRRGVVAVNAFLLQRQTAADPAALGYANATTPACTTSTALLCTPQTLVRPDAATTFVFADQVHPTTAAHLAIAQVVISELDAPGQMSLLAEAPVALLRGHRAAVRAELDRAPAEGAGWRLFASADAGVRRLDGDWAAPSARSTDEAFTAGALWRSGGGFTTGLAITKARAQVKLDGGLGGFDVDEVAGSAFAQMTWAGGLWASLQAGAGAADDDDIVRSFAVGAAVGTERARSKGSDYSVEVAAGRWMRLGGLRTGPFAALAYDRIHVKGVREVAADATSMWFAPQVREAEVARIGWRLDGGATLGGAGLHPTAAIAYAHDFGADRRSLAAGLTTFNGEFEMPGYQPSRNWGEASVGVETELARGLQARISYQGLFGDRGRENLGVLGLSYAF